MLQLFFKTIELLNKERIFCFIFYLILGEIAKAKLLQNIIK